MEEITAKKEKKNNGAATGQADHGGEEEWVLDSSVDRCGRVPRRAATGCWKAAMFIICT